jgi:GAF domain-containing protein
VDNLEDEQRWPKYRARALELGIRSSMSFQLFTDGRNLGALNLYSQQPHAFDEDAEQIGLLFAAHAAIALRGEQRETELQKAVRSRDTIGVAKGILMERYKVTDDQAFGMLVRISQHEHIKLLDVAAFLARSGQEPSEAKK